MDSGWRDRLFNIFNGLLCMLILLITIYPIYFVVVASISDPVAVVKGNVYLWPKDFTLEAYANVFKESQIWTGYGNTIIYTLFGTLWNLVLTISAAYVLSKRDLPGRAILSWFFFITMYFSGGIVPSYMLYKDLGLLNTRWACILGAGVNCWNLIVTRAFFTGTIPTRFTRPRKSTAQARRRHSSPSPFRCLPPSSPSWRCSTAWSTGMSTSGPCAR